MSRILNYISDLFVFWNLKKISNGYLNLIDSTGKEYFFGDKKSPLKAKIKINDSSFCYKILRKGSPGLAESYINGEFETEDLASLIELSARNIKRTSKFSKATIASFSEEKGSLKILNSYFPLNFSISII